jgi:hypothetical protein
MSAQQKSIGRANAIALSESGWWRGQPARELAKFQLMTRELCMPFEVFRQSLETALGRPVWIHELGFNLEAIIQELFGERDAPTLDQILDLLPAAKRCVISL